MLLTAILFTAIVISIFDIILVYISSFQHENLRKGVLLYFICLLTIFIEHLIEYSGNSCDLPHFIYSSAPFYLLLFPCFNLIVNSVFNQKSNWKKFLVEVIPSIGYTTLLVPFFIMPGELKCNYLNAIVTESRFGSHNHLILIGILLIQTLVYSVSWYGRIFKYSVLIKLKTSSTEIEFVPWILRIIGVISLFTFIIILGWLARAFWPGNYYMIDKLSNSVLSLIPCVFLFLLFFLPERALPKASKGSAETKNEKEFNPMHLAQLEKVMEEEKPYLNPDLNLSEVAEKLHVSRHELSNLLSQGFQKSFYDFVNEYRIVHARKLMDSEVIKTFSLSGIARESGFNNYVSFYRVFKRFTMTTPSAYLKEKRT